MKKKREKSLLTNEKSFVSVARPLLLRKRLCFVNRAEVTIFPILWKKIIFSSLKFSNVLFASKLYIKLVFNLDNLI